MSPIRVCFPYVGDSVGGSHISSILALRHMDLNRVTPIVVLHHPRGPLADYLAELDLPFASLPLTGLAGQSPHIHDIALKVSSSLLPISRFLNANSIDVVHTNDLRMHLSWVMATRLARRKFLWNQRVVVSNSPLWRILATGSHWIASVSEAARATLPPNGRIKSEVIYSPFECPDKTTNHSEARRNLIERFGLPAESRIVGFVGNVTAQKRPLVFVDMAVRLCATTQDDWSFIMVGEDRAGLKQQIVDRAETEGISDRLHLVGYQRAAVDLIAGFDVLVSCGVGEAYGRVLVEAALVGTPIVATDSGGNSEIVFDDTVGLLVPVDDAKRTAETVMEIVGNNRRTPARSRQLLEERHAPHRCARSFETVYENLVRPSI